jgi:hypothetical protein
VSPKGYLNPDTRLASKAKLLNRFTLKWKAGVIYGSSYQAEAIRPLVHMLSKKNISFINITILLSIYNIIIDYNSNI